MLAALSSQSSSSSSSDQYGSSSSSAQNALAVGASGSTSSNVDQFVKDLAGLLNDVQSGDTAGAKQAATAVSHDLAAVALTSAAASSLGGSPTDPLSTVMNDLGDSPPRSQATRRLRLPHPLRCKRIWRRFSPLEPRTRRLRPHRAWQGRRRPVQALRAMRHRRRARQTRPIRRSRRKSCKLLAAFAQAQTAAG